MRVTLNLLKKMKKLKRKLIRIKKGIKHINLQIDVSLKYISSLKNHVERVLNDFRIAKKAENLDTCNILDFTKLNAVNYNKKTDQFIKYLEQLEPKNLSKRNI